MSLTVIVRVLFLDGGPERLPLDLIESLDGVKLVVTYEGRSNMLNPRGRCYVSGHSLALARNASTDNYDVIIIGNNWGTGRAKAEALPTGLEDITMISFDKLTPEAVIDYLGIGFHHCGTRRRSIPGEIDVASFIASKALQMMAT